MPIFSRRSLTAFALSALGCCSFGASTPIEPRQMIQELAKFGELGRVLYVAAHPDDENTHLITYLARGRNYQTAYLSLTRGDGGQNVLGSDFGERLGVARTFELMEARKLDGGRQFFTRAMDFGFSKSHRETLRVWNESEVLSDVVRVIRSFRPDVIITRFSPEPGGTHGHHTASAILAVEAFKRAGDSAAFPEQLTTLKPWQPKRVFWNNRDSGEKTIAIEAKGTDPVLGQPFGEIAGRSRAMHKTQGFDNFTGGGAGGTQFLRLLAGEPATHDLMDGVNTTWKRFGSSGGEIDRRMGEIAAAFKPENPSGIVPALLDIRALLAELPQDPVVLDKREHLDRILQSCLGLEVQTAAARTEYFPRESMPLRHTITTRAPAGVELKLKSIRYANPADRGTGLDPERLRGSGEAVVHDTVLRPDQPLVLERRITINEHVPLTHPYWLRDEGTAGLARVEPASLIGRPDNPPSFPIELQFQIGGQTLVLVDQPVFRTEANETGETTQPVAIVAPVALHFTSGVVLFKDKKAQEVSVEITGVREKAQGVVRLNLEPGWSCSPATRDFALTSAGEKTTVRFSITPPDQAGKPVFVAAAAEVDGLRYGNDRVEVRYRHLPRQLLQPAARAKLVPINLDLRGNHVGFLPGSGDDTVEALTAMGYRVTVLTDSDLTPEKLQPLDAVVLGARAFNVREGLGANLAGLFKYVEAGGTVIAQYNRPDRLKSKQLAPYNLTITSDRVTEEDAAVTFLTPHHPVLGSPNKLGPEDFQGWVQERGIYYPREWGPEWTPVLAAGDEGQKPHAGGLLIARHGKGHYVYTGLSFFRQLPAGVPGAYRLFANLVSLGKP